MPSLRALDLPLGPELEAALRDCFNRRQAFCILDQRVSARRRLDELSWLGATEVLDSQGLQLRASGVPVDEDVALVMLTSGSSGTPKAALHTWSSLEASASMTQATLRDTNAPVWFPCLPANHIGGLAVLLRAVASDASLVWGTDDDIDAAPTRGATHIAVVRTQLARHDLSGYRTVLLGGAKPPTALPPNVVTTWGMTETGSGIVYDGVPLPGVEVAAIDGQLCLRSPTLFREYRTAPRPALAGPDGRSDWFPTGDGGTFVDGVVRVRGRIGFVITSGGEKIWPEDVEAALSTVAGVRDVAVTGVDDPEWGQRLVALVVAPGGGLDAQLRERAAEAIGPWAKPKEIRYVAAIPRTSNGKIRRDALATLF